MIKVYFGPFIAQFAGLAALFLGLGAAGAWLWAVLPSRARRRLAAPAVLLAAVATVAVMWVGQRPDWDETEHLHSAWLMSQGALPFRDFWQHHSPMLWIALSPVLGAMSPGAHVCDFARGLSLSLSAAACLMAILLARRLHGPQAPALMVIALWAGIIEPGQLHQLRPDLVANMLSLAALALLLSVPGAARAVLAGVLLGLAAAFTPKHLPLLLVLPLVLAWEGCGLLRLVRLASLHWLGGLAGLAPLWLWLVHHGLEGDFIYWVFQFNEAGMRYGGGIPLLLLAAVVAWAARVRVDRGAQMRHGERIAWVALLMTVLVYFIQPFHKTTYGLQMFMLLAAAVGSVEARQALQALGRARRFHYAGALVALYFLPTFLMGHYWLAKRDYFAGRAEIGGLISVMDGGPVFAVPPGHPIFAHDVTDVNQPWQWHRWLWRPEIAARLADTAERIISARPAIIIAGEGVVTPAIGSDVVPTPLGGMPAERLARAGVMTEEEAGRLQAFLEQDYTLIRLNRRYYWLRNDRPFPPGCYLARPGDMPTHTPRGLTAPLGGRDADDR